MPRTANGSKPLTFDQINERKTRVTVDVPVTLDGGDVAIFVLGTIGRPQWELLLAEHPATDEQQAAHRANQEAQGIEPLFRGVLRWNEDTFPPALIAAACVEPALTFEQATVIWQDDEGRWSASECEELFQAAVQLNDPQFHRQQLIASLGKGSKATEVSAPS